jgi:hypothetical protein
MKSTRNPNNAHRVGPAVTRRLSPASNGGAGLDSRREGSGTRSLPNQNSAGSGGPIPTRDHEDRADPGRVKGRCKGRSYALVLD